jgi:hypothetical protein
LLDVHPDQRFGCCKPSIGSEPCHCLVPLVMPSLPSRDVRRVFWILDHSSSPRGAPCVRRLQVAIPTLVPVHPPVHARGRNQIDSHISIAAQPKPFHDDPK